ncbi:MAG TPA: type II secretion system F family protein [Candidatus Nanoarchaeia archaeon]|nr:type II secretion system F family protein [Candidatus Nanoarchaeia archaeon]
MELKKPHWMGIGFSVLVIITAFIFYGSEAFFLIIGIGIIIGILPFVLTVIYEARLSNEKEEMFLEFARDLVESVKTGTPISKSIVNMKNKPFGILSPNINKLANQISLGVPLNQALQVFSRDVDNKAISRILTLIGQAERAGGDIGEILENVAGAVNMSDKLKKERKAIISSLVTQGYIIFFVFMVIILVMQYKILPMLSGIADVRSLGNVGIGLGTGGGDISQISSAFLYLLLIQGAFSGLTIGKLSEGSLKAGIKHSFALMLLSFIMSAGAGLVFG